MALKPCRECGQQVSTEAEVCPHCGVRSPTMVAALGRPSDSEQNESAQSPEENKNLWPLGKKVKIAVFIFVGIMFTIKLIGIATNPNESPNKHYASTTNKTELQYKIVKFTAPGCKNSDIFSKLVHFKNQKDEEAIKKLMVGEMLSGQCIIFKEGDAVYLDNTKIFSGLICLRPQGDVSCFWTYLEATK